MTAWSLMFLVMAAEPGPAADAPTYANDVAAIVHAKCAGCHRPGQSGPFSLLTFDDVEEHAGTIAAVLEADYMPPWPPSDRSLPLRHDRRLTDGERTTLVAWAETGAPPGDLSTAPEPPDFPDGWTLGPPDLVLSMDEVFPVPADGRDIYRWFSLPLDRDEPLYVKAFEFRSTSDGAVHHALIYADKKQVGRSRVAKDGLPGFRGMRVSPNELLGGFVPGTIPAEWPEDLATVIPAGADLVLQTHFHPNGRAAKEQSTVGLYLADQKPSRPLHSIQLPPGFGRASNLNIPAGASDYTIRDSLVLPCDVRAIGVSGHAHYICETMTLTAESPGGEQRTLFDIDDWDLDWQGDYHFAEPFVLPAGTILRVELVYDNSTANLDNPWSPPRRIQWGEESTDEMGSIDLVVTTTRQDDERAMRRLKTINRTKLFKPGPTPDPSEPVSQAEQRRFAKLDADDNGTLQRDEVPQEYRQLFDLVDMDENGDVTPIELRAIRHLFR